MSAAKTAAAAAAKATWSRTVAAPSSACGATRSLSSTTSVDRQASPASQRAPTMDTKGAAALARMKKGPGYRSSFSGMVATVFGASGGIGRGVCNRLGKSGSQLILPYRGDHYPYMRFKTYGDLGQILFTPFHLKDDASIARAVKHSNVVINLIGREMNTRNFNQWDVNVEGPRRLARIAREAGVERFVHISNINARPEPDRIWSLRGSDLLRSKWEGEQAVLQEFPDATIFRPTDVYGIDDKFIWHYFRWGRWGFNGRMPLWKSGEETVKAPLHFSDLASGIFNSLSDPAAKGTIYEAYGPHSYKLSDLMDWMAAVTNRDPVDYGYKRTDLRLAYLPWAKAFLLSKVLPLGCKTLGGHTFDKLERTSLSDDILGLPNLLDLGVKAAPVGEKMPFELIHVRAFAHYQPYDPEDILKIPDPIPLDTVEAKRIKDRARASPMLGLAF
jgi:NADH dehydrogenase (ubiquinone) 1 alpha subcomplex subunit 9